MGFSDLARAVEGSGDVVGDGLPCWHVGMTEQDKPGREAEVAP